MRFWNGTTANIAKVEGTPEYLSAMRILAEDAQLVMAGHPSEL
jgi:hypothetical protein